MGLFDIPDTSWTPEQANQWLGHAATAMENYWPQMVRIAAETMPAQQIAANKQNMIAMEGTGDVPGMLALIERNQGTYDRINRQARQAGVDTDAHLVEQYAGRFHNVDKAANRELYEAIGAQDQESALSAELQQQGLGTLAVVPQLDTGYAMMNAPLHDIYQKRAEAVQRDGRLSAEQMRDVQQATRAADSARGVMRSGMSVGNEILNTQKARQAQQRFDEGSLAMTGDMINRNVASNMAGRASLLQSAAGIDQQTFNQQQARIGNRAATRFDPIQAVLGRQGFPGMTPGQGAAFSQGAAGMGSQFGSGLFDQWSTMAGANAGLYQSGRNAQASAQADLNSGILGFAGEAFGPVLGKGLGKIFGL